MIRIHNLSKSYPLSRLGRKDAGSIALHPLSAVIPQGSVSIIVGQNGSGKSTFLSLLAGQISHYQGTLEIDGKPAPDHTRSAPVSYAAEIAHFPPHWSVRQVLQFVGMLQGLSSREMQVALDRVCTKLELTDSLNHLFGTLSKGMRQRVNLAQSLLSRSPLVIWDEPVSGLDWVLIERVKNMILELKAAGVTVVLSSHDLCLVRETAEFILHLHEGQLRYQGDIEGWRRFLVDSSLSSDQSLLRKLEF